MVIWWEYGHLHPFVYLQLNATLQNNLMRTAKQKSAMGTDIRFPFAVEICNDADDYLNSLLEVLLKYKIADFVQD